MKKEITCEDCKYYIQHYTKATTEFRKMLYGHCVKPNGHYRKTDKICKDFAEKDLEEIEEARLKTVAELLTDIADRISKLQEVFKE